MTLSAGAEQSIAIEIGCERQPEPVRLLPLAVARDQAAAEHGRSQAWQCRLTSVNGQFNVWFNRAVSDLHMLVTALPTGPYPYAGLPWFNTPFGRDGLITALECLWMRPDLARGVLHYLAATQATAVDAEQDAEPGKILHETRTGEMATLKEMPYGKYYGSVDATPLFVLLAGAYYERTGDLRVDRGALAQSPGGPRLDRHVWRSRRRRAGRVSAEDAAGPAASRLERLGRRHLSRRRFAGRRPDRTLRGSGLCLRRLARPVHGWPRRWARLQDAECAHDQGRGRAPAIRGARSGARTSARMPSRSTATKRPCRVRSSNARSLSVHGDRRVRPRPPRRPDDLSPRLLFGLGRAHVGGRGSEI